MARTITLEVRVHRIFLYILIRSSLSYKMAPANPCIVHGEIREPIGVKNAPNTFGK